MEIRHITRFMAVLIVLLSGIAWAQLAGAPTVVSIDRFDELIGALARVEQKLDRLLTSRWEYTSIGRNRLGSQIQDTASEIERLGQEGWELVTVTVEEGFIFKRRVVP